MTPPARHTLPRPRCRSSLTSETRRKTVRADPGRGPDDTRRPAVFCREVSLPTAHRAVGEGGIFVSQQLIHTRCRG